MVSHFKQFSIKLNDLLNGYFTDDKLNKITIKGLSLDSRKIKSGDLFFAISGEKVEGVEFINGAIEKGAAAVLWETNAEVEAIQVNWRKTAKGLDVPIIAIPDLTQLVGEFANRFYASPSDNISVYGVTGTNGKTSCADFIAQMLSIDTPCGLLGTLGKGLYPDLEETGFTTPDAISCHQWLANIQLSQAKY
ncbi:MAG: UDP-N-acetylmuramoyl-L-alanyl-D-glutamate--2,6-diaminopimelate ligase, partial [Gammaproteobacteria bacterium]|nr:UDP-N-acetylmuramoyl-L-alanyl-D-glutamate--2,6-diaminopimelate ligase [Gammaproteobacteria bacterium]